MQHPMQMQHPQERPRQLPAPLYPGQQHASSSSLLIPPSDDAPPHKVPVRAMFSRVTPMEPGDPFPSISSHDQARVKKWIDRDLEFEQELAVARQRKRAEITGLAEELVTGQDWLGPTGPLGQFKIRWDDEKDREQASKIRGPLRKPIKLSKRQLRGAAARSEVLVPVRLEIEHEAWKLRDTFTWNLLESDITPETFASHLCADLRLPERPFFKEIVSTIKRAIEDAQSCEQYEVVLGEGALREAEETRKWFDDRAYERRQRPVMDGLIDGGEVKVEELTGTTNDLGSEELRIAIKLDITLDNFQLVDRVEWDITNPRNSPEDFAETFSAELGLTGEFRTAIAHSIREQVDNYTRSLALLNYASTGAVTDDDLRREFLPAVQDVFRYETADLYSPVLNQLSTEDVDRNEKEREREIRRKRRQTKGRGVSLPDREAVKTHRTLVPRPLPGLMQTQMNGGDVVYPLPEIAQPYPLVVKSLPSKPEGVDISDAASLRLFSKDREVTTGPAQPLRGAALANANARRARLAGGESLQPEGRPEDFGLHQHIIDGHWFCANCGVPDTLAIGRRKGPTGTHNLCGACGKFYQRFRKQRVCEYTTDYETHVRRQAEAGPRGKPVGRPRRANGPATATPTEGTPAGRGLPGPSRAGPPQITSRADSPASPRRETQARPAERPEDEEEDEDDSDDSAPVRPPRKKKRANQYGSPDTPFVDDSNSGSDSEEESDNDEEGNSGPSPPPPPPPPPAPAQARPIAPLPLVQDPSVSIISMNKTDTAPPEPLPWMIAAASDLRARQIDDRFELIPKPKAGDPSNVEWRIRCLDCPGKLYNLGPGQTFEGFLVHFKNRNHRTNVENRLASQQSPQ